MLNDVESFWVQVLNNFRDTSGSETSWSQIRIVSWKTICTQRDLPLLGPASLSAFCPLARGALSEGLWAGFEGEPTDPSETCLVRLQACETHLGRSMNQERYDSIWFMIIGARIVRLRELGRRHVQINFKSPPSQWLRTFEAERYHDCDESALVHWSCPQFPIW